MEFFSPQKVFAWLTYDDREKLGYREAAQLLAIATVHPPPKAKAVSLSSFALMNANAVPNI